MKAIAAPLVAALAVVSVAAAADSSSSPALAPLGALYPELEKLSIDIHQNPELSQHEEKTSAKLAEKLRALGYRVTDHIGGFGVVGILENGSGPTVMLRTELDALPVEEKTGLPYASHVTAKDDSGATVAVAHACGHDTHMAAWVGAATLLSRAKSSWRGTLMMVAQGDEEKSNGAGRMLADGLFTKFRKPDYAVAVHDDADFPAGTVAIRPGFAMANVDSVDVTIYGRGGHGAYPSGTVDPIVIAARTILALQTLVSRENNPLDPAVVTVGSIHGGTKHNIIPDEVKLQLTVRSYSDSVRKALLDGIARIAKAEAVASRAPKEPSVTVSGGNSAVYNDPDLSTRLAKVFRRTFGDSRVVESPPKMVSEDFSEYGRAGVPTVMVFVGGVPPQKFEQAKASGTPLPSLHSSQWAPDREPTIKTAVGVEVAAALELLGSRPPKADPRQ
jgi:hippurate hydrolase